MKRLVLVRHGESHWNAEGRIQGQACAGLSDRGHDQAAALAARIAEAWPAAHVVTSDLPRCIETTAPIVVALERVPREDPRLRERSFGDWSGRLRAEVAAMDAQRWARWGAGDDGVIAEVGGESATQLADRVEPALWELLDTTPDGGVTVAVTHGGPIWHGLHRLLDLPQGSLGPVSNAGISEVVSFHPGQAILDRWNDVGHLPAEQRTAFAATVAPVSDAPPVGR